MQNFIQGYKIPAKLEDRPDLPKRIGRVFRDEDELAGDELTPQIEGSPTQLSLSYSGVFAQFRQVKYVNEEIEYFKSLGGETKILPYIIAGKATTGRRPRLLLRTRTQRKPKETSDSRIRRIGMSFQGFGSFSPLFASHIITVLSSEPLAKYFPSGLQQTELRHIGMSFQGFDF